MQIREIGIALRAAFERHRRYHMIRRELEACSPRVLADIGIRREDIHDVAWKTAGQRVAERFGRAPVRASGATVPQIGARLSSHGA